MVLWQMGLQASLNPPKLRHIETGGDLGFHQLGAPDGFEVCPWPGDRNANQGSSRESIRANRFAEQTLVSKGSSDPRESPQTCDWQCSSAPKRDSQKKGVQFRNPHAIRSNLTEHAAYCTPASFIISWLFFAHANFGFVAGFLVRS